MPIARYAGEYNGIKLAAVSGWSQTNGCGGNQTAGPNRSASLVPGCINSPTTTFIAVASGGAVAPYDD